MPSNRDSLTEQLVGFESLGAGVGATLIRPNGGDAKLPAVVLLHDLYGVTDHVRETGRRLAQQGYAVLAVDLYSRGDGPNPPWPPKREETAKMIDFPDRQAGADVKGAIDWLKACPYVDAAKVGAVGFSFGARCIMLACHVGLDVAASVHYYPVLIYPFLSDSRPRQPLTFLPEMPHPTQVFFGDEDALVPATHVTFFRDLLRATVRLASFLSIPE